MNAANEIAVEAFVNRRINFPQIAETVRRAMDAHRVVPHPTLEQILEADAWARRVSGGLIDRFPGGIAPPTAMVLATVLAARSTWREPYHVVDGNRLSRPDGKRPGGAASSWAGRLQLVLASPEASGNQIMRSPAGDLAVHRVQTKSGLVVTSVIARQEVPAREVLPAALRIATGGSNPSGMNAVSLFDLPLGHDELWSIEEYKATESERRERLQSLVPAWEAHSMHDLFAMPLEFETAARAITAMIENSPLPPQARQMAVARYTRTGFEAAAISTFNALGLAMVLPSARRGIVRRATLRFGHPFAVVAVVGGVPNPLDDLVGDTAGGPWRGLPVFSGWVAEPGEAEREDDLRGESLEELPVADLLPPCGKPASAKGRSRPSWWRRLARLWSRAH